jgi:hypothetical protein
VNLESGCTVTEVRMSTNPEQERLRRLRDRQIAARDPQTGARKLHGGISRKQRRAVESFSLGKIWREIPHVWRYAFYGFVVGALGVAVVPVLWDSPWALTCTAGATVFLVVIGVFVGRAADTRDSLKDLTH